MKHNTGLNCIELGSGANTQVVSAAADPGPPDGFIDNTVKVYKMNPDGSKGEYIRDMEAFPEGWAQGSLKNPNKSEDEKGEDIMPQPRPDRDEIVAKAKAIMASTGKNVNQTAIELGVPVGTLGYWLKHEKQTPDPEPEKVGRQDPVQDSKEPAKESLPEEVPPVNMPIGMELPPERVSYTSHQYQEQVNQGNYSPEDNDFTPEDDQPIPFRVVSNDVVINTTQESQEAILKAFKLIPPKPTFDLAPVKIQLICTALAEYKDELLPADVTLDLVKAINDIQLAEVR